ncbi:hypothetical protein [Microbacterium sp. HJ5]
MIPNPAHAGQDCGFSGWQDKCELSNSGGQVDISAGLSRPGSAPPRTDDALNRPEGPSRPAPDEEASAPEDCGPLGCRGDYAVAMLPRVTLADLASFRPATPELTGEPAGFGVVGMPTNLVGAASEQHLPGSLLGWDVTVRFTPAQYVFAHGDGTTATTTTGGASWERLGQAQFTPTATSHSYADRGTFPVSVTVRYAASVDFGNGWWQPVDGFVTATSGQYPVRVVEVRTALVDETCREDPGGPGC